MTRRARALARLLALQAAWNYERMQGIGMGWAAAPLLEELRERDPGRHREATARAAGFFNGHPYLAGLALGATVRAELDGTPPEMVGRLRTALGGPLGAVGDSLFWAGLLPALAGAAILGVVLGAPGLAIGALLVGWNGFRLATTAWALDTGLREGPAVGRALRESWLTGAAQRIGRVAGLAIGAAVPAACAWLLGGLTGPAGLTAAAVAGVGVLLARLRPAWFTGLRYGLLLVGAVALLTLLGLGIGGEPK